MKRALVLRVEVDQERFYQEGERLLASYQAGVYSRDFPEALKAAEEALGVPLGPAAALGYIETARVSMACTWTTMSTLLALHREVGMDAGDEISER